MATTTESLIVELDAKIDKYIAKMGDAEKANKKTGASATEMGKAIVDGIKKATAAVLAISLALSAMIIVSAKGRIELDLMSRQAKLSASEFQSLAFATNQFGINAEQIADISKDIGDKLGEFARDASGPFQDFANQMKLSKVEAQKLAIEFGTLSSDKVIGRMISMMEAVNTPADQVTQVLESMGNDLSRLVPLFTDNSKALKEMRARFDDVNKSLSITQEQAVELRETAVTFDLMTSSAGKASTAISATLAPVFNDFFNDVIKVIPDATQVIIDFINTFLDAEDIKSLSDLNRQIDSSASKTKILKEELALLNEQRAVGKNTIGAQISARQNLILSIEQETQRTKELDEQLVKLTESRRLADAERLEGGEISATGGGEFGTGAGGGQLRAIEDRFKSETQLLLEKHEEEKAILDLEVEDLEVRNELKLKLNEELKGKLEGIDAKAFELKKKQDKKTADDQKKDELVKFKNQEKIIGAGMALNSALFDDNKAIAAGLVIADTASAIMKSLSINPYDYVNVGVLAATGIAQLANATGASKGGGDISGGTGLGRPQQQDFAPETTGLELSEATGAGSDVRRIEFSTDTGDDLINAIAQALNQGQKTGQFS